MKTVIGRVRYHRNKHKHGRGVNRIVYVPIAIERHLKLQDKDFIEYCLTDDMHIEIRKAPNF